MNVAQICEALKDLIKADTSNFDGVIVERDEFVNDDPDQARIGWIGIYRNRVKYNPDSLGAAYIGRYHLNPITLTLIIQVTDYDSGEACADRLEALIASVISLLLTNDSISGLIDYASRMEVSYAYDPRSDKGKLYMQTAIMEIDLEVANG